MLCVHLLTTNCINVDSRKKDCLRQFLVVLCETGKLAQLVAFDYGDLETEVVAVLEARARGLDLFTHDYYSLLYSFHIYREDYRAGECTYLPACITKCLPGCLGACIHCVPIP